MHWMVPAGAGLFVFWLRDAMVAAAVRSRLSHALGIWTAVTLTLFSVLGAAAESISREQASQLWAEPRYWIPALAIHALLWAATQFLRRKSTLAAWLSVMAPAPVFVFSAGAACWVLLNRVGGLDGWQAGLLLGAVWVGSVRLAAWLFRGFPAWRVLDIAGAANLSAIILVPLRQQAEETSAASAPLEWTSTLLPLLVAGLLVAASFAFHRFQSNRHATHS